MCGIAAIIHPLNLQVDRNELERFTRTLEHRGPDGEGFFIDNNIGLGHKRLAIIDLETGSQPMFTYAKDVCIVFNGEIYNYTEIKGQLIAKGYNFATTSDTEVILNSYIEWGEKCVNYFNGMWAFIIFDMRKTRKIFVSRDRMGIKPIYYANTNGKYFFSSEIKSFLSLNNFKIEFNKNVLWDYLVFGPSYGGKTYLNDIYELSPGQNLIIENNKLTVSNYYYLENTFLDNVKKADIKEIENIFYDSVRLRLRSDVPLGTINSGGLDSSLISVFAKKQLKHLKTYSVAPENDSNNKILEGDESFFAEYLSRYINSSHNTIRYSKSTFYNLFAKCVNDNDGELFHSNSVPMNLMFREIKKDGITVVLGGEGADEVFRGYYSNKIMNYFLYINNKLARIIVLLKYYNRSHLLNFHKSMLRTIPLIRNNYCSPANADKILNIKGEPSEKRLELFRIMDGLSPQNALSFYEQTSYLSGLLRRADRMSMAYGVELRVPFLDYRLVEKLNGIHHSAKVGKLFPVEKKILRNIGSNHLPKIILKRKKYGFASPVREYRELFSKILESYNIHDKNLSLREIYAICSLIPKSFSNHIT